MNLPPDRSDVSTEHRHPLSMNMDSLGTPAFIDLMVRDHRTVADSVAAASESLGRFIDELVSKVRRGGRLIYIGAGTSGRLGVLDASECPPTFQADPDQVIGIIAGGDSSLRKSSEGREDEIDGAAEALNTVVLTDRDTLLGIAAGGTTPYVLGALRIAKRSRATTGLLTCAPLRQHPEACDHLITLDTGPELLTGSTRLKAGSATKLTLNIISTAVFTQLGKVHGNLMVDLRATNQKLADRALRILREFCPHLDRAGAWDVLQHAEGRLKLAILMHKRGMSLDDAKKMLAEADGVLRRALEKVIG